MRLISVVVGAAPPNHVRQWSDQVTAVTPGNTAAETVFQAVLKR